MSNYSSSTPLTHSGNRELKGSAHGRTFLYDFRYVPNGRPKPVVIFVHGFKGFKDWGYFNLAANRLAEAGLVVAKLNLSHNGTTPEAPLDFDDLEAFGQNNFGLELDDLGQLMDRLLSDDSPLPAEEADRSGLSLIGHSRGGSLVLLKAAEDSRVQKVVTWAAVSNLENRWPETFMTEWKEKGVQYIPNARTGQNMPLYYQLAEDFIANRDRYSLPDLVPTLQAPLLILHGTADESVEDHCAHELKQWKPDAKLVLVEGADHVFGGGHPWPHDHLPAHASYILDQTAGFLL